MTWKMQMNYHSPSMIFPQREAADKPVSDYHVRCSKKHMAKKPQVRPLCVEFYRWSNKEKTVLFAQKVKTGGYRKESGIKAYAGHLPAHANSQRPATPFALSTWYHLWHPNLSTGSNLNEKAGFS